MATINGVVTIGVSETPGAATVCLFNEPGNVLVATTTSNASTGAYSFTGVPDGLQYRVVVLGDNVYRSRAYGPCVVGDPYWNQVVTLLHLNGTDGAISFTDEKGKTWSASGNAQIDEAQAKFGVSSLIVDGSGDLISTGDHADWSFGSGDFTVEGFFRFNSLSAGSAVFAGHWSTTGNQREWLLWYDITNDLLSFSYSVDGSSAPSIQHAWVPNVNTWYHVAASRVGNTLYLFVDGALIGSSAFNFTLFGSSASLTVGHANTTALALNGWVDEFRVTKGVGRYSAAFAAPISPFSNTQAEITFDPYYANVVSLLHFDGADGSTTFTDQTGKTWTAAGNAQIDTAQSQFGGASGLFDGAGDYISTPNHADWDFGSGDFTIECFVRRNSAALGHVVGKWSTSNRGWVIFIKADGNAQFSYSTTGSNFIDAVGTIPIPLSTWVHVAAVRSGATVTVYVGGVQAVVHNIGASTIFNSTRVLEVGLENSIGYAPFDGWLDELRITKGVARYVTDFTPPVAAFPNS